MTRIVFLLLVAAVAQDDKKAQVDVVIGGAEGATLPKDVTLRVRVNAITPGEPGAIAWRYMGEGLGGEVIKGAFSATPLAVGTWSPAVPIVSLAGKRFPKKLFLTVTTGRGGKRGKDAVEGHSTGVEMEFEVAWQGRVLKTFKETGPDGGTVGIVIPAWRLAGGKTPADPDFLADFTGLLEYATRRAARLEAVAGQDAPRPSKFGITTSLAGYGQSHGYGVRFTNRAILEQELRAMKVLGVNGLKGEASFPHIVYAQLGGFPVPKGGCPFGPDVPASQQAMIQSGLDAALKMQTDEVWWRTVDEIGTIADHTPEGKSHFAVCARCTEAYRAWLKGRGVKDWAEAKPADLLAKDAGGMNLYRTQLFSNHATAQLFTPLRDAIAKANEEKRKNPALKQPWVYSFALRGNTFNMGGHSLDFFDFYRHADNAMVYETSNRDPRVWIWDSYLCDVGRILMSREKTEFGVYIKPHRGAPIQRALSAASRGARFIYWYTYGPEYVKGDSFAESEAALEATARAGAILGRAEDLLYRPAWAVAPEVAVVNPRSSELWNKGAAPQPAPYENAKWIYTALAHAHIPVDPLDEVMLENEDLARYKVIYVSGTNLTAAAAAKVAAWVKEGGTLYTSGGGLARDEANRPLVAMEPVLGLQGRGPVEHWAKVKPYGATQIETWTEPAVRAEIAGKCPLVVGREVLKPAGAEVVAMFSDGGAALTRHSYGKGKAWVAGFYPGLEYSAAIRAAGYDMSTGFDAVRRSLIAAAALERVSPVVDAGQPLVEGILLRNEGRRGITLMNWAYRERSLVPFKDLKIIVRGAGEVAKATSTVLRKELKVEKTADGIVILLPTLDEGDVLRLE